MSYENNRPHNKLRKPSPRYWKERTDRTEKRAERLAESEAYRGIEPLVQRQGGKLSADDMLDMLTLKRAGMNAEGIAELKDVSRTAVYNVFEKLKKAGMKVD
jgi:hypothetical protein